MGLDIGIGIGLLSCLGSIYPAEFRRLFVLCGIYLRELGEEHGESIFHRRRCSLMFFWVPGHRYGFCSIVQQCRSFIYSKVEPGYGVKHSLSASRRLESEALRVSGLVCASIPGEGRVGIPHSAKSAHALVTASGIPDLRFYSLEANRAGPAWGAPGVGGWAQITSGTDNHLSHYRPPPSPKGFIAASGQFTSPIATTVTQKYGYNNANGAAAGAPEVELTRI